MRTAGFVQVPHEDPPSANSLRRALARARDGKPIDQSEAAVLLHARGEQLTELLRYAARTRDAGLAAAGRPGVITYSRKVFIPLTRLCRDRCGYCTFVTVPGRLAPGSEFLTPDEVLDVARQGAALGCKEALFTLGDRPEARWRQAREWLNAHGYDDTCPTSGRWQPGARGDRLLPHLNPGVLTWQDFQRLKPVAPSMGMMLETTARGCLPSAAGRPAARTRIRRSGSGCWRTLPVCRAVHDRDPDRNRRDLAERVDSIFAIRGWHASTAPCRK
jgi:FO synthase